jgi:hypothetical protein
LGLQKLAQGFETAAEALTHMRIDMSLFWIKNYEALAVSAVWKSAGRRYSQDQAKALQIVIL